MGERRNILTEMVADSMVPHPSGECRSTLPGSIIVCTLPWGHPDDHRSPDPWAATWPNDVPTEAAR